jgi:hypothetical protein
MAERKWTMEWLPHREHLRLNSIRATQQAEEKAAEERHQTFLRRKLLMLQVFLASPWAIEQMAKG